MIFDWPIGTVTQRAAHAAPPETWEITTRYGERYKLDDRWVYHTGVDFSLRPTQRDAADNMIIYAPADGLVLYAGMLTLWGKMIVIRHNEPEREPLWTRLAHLDLISVKDGTLILRGEPLGTVSAANAHYAYHLHYDIARFNLGAKPSDWPGSDQARVLQGYLDPLDVMRQQRSALFLSLIVRAPSVKMRVLPQRYSPVVATLGQGEACTVLQRQNEWAYVRVKRAAGSLTGWILTEYTEEFYE